MLIDVKCPCCRDTIPVTEAAGEQTVDCPRCGERFVVPAAGGAAPRPAAERSRPVAPKARKPTRRRRYDDDDEEDDDRPRRRDTGGAKGGMLGIIVAGGVGLFVLVCGVGLAAWLIFSKGDPEAAANKPADNKAPVNNPADQKPPRVVADRNPGGPAVPPTRPEPRKKPGLPAAPAAPVVTLPAPAGDVCVGGGGKYLFLHLKTARQVAVLDLAAGKVTKYLPTADDDVLIAAGLNHLVLGYPRQLILQRYSLATFEKDRSGPVPSKWPLRGLGLGSASNGPLLVVCGEFPKGKDLFLVDVLTLRRAEGSDVRNANFWPEAGMRVWAAQDGRTFTAKAGGLGRPTAFQIRPNGWVVTPSPCDPPLLGADGELVAGNGLIARPNGQHVGERRHDVRYVPAAEGPFLLALTEQKAGEWPNERKYAAVQVLAGPGRGPVVTYPELPETEGFTDPFQEPHKALDRHIVFLPFANVLAILPAARDRVYLRKTNLKANLETSAVDYLVVVSRPPAARKGQTFRYTPEVWSKRGGVRLSLDAGPPGMTAEGGTVVWPVPAGFAEPTANVILTATDAGGQTAFHAFDLPVFTP